MKGSISFTIAALTSAVFANPFLGHPSVPIPPQSAVITANGANYGVANFTQLIDHTDPRKGTFQQRYWWNSEFWAGPGSPVVFFTPGEEDAAGYTGYLYNITIVGIFAQAIEGAAIVFEHRYYGESSPYDELTSETLQYLNLHQNIADFVYFAKSVDLPFDTNHSSNAESAPWVFSGGSYSGALSAYTESVSPGTFWAYHASSAPVEAIYDYWQYFYPVEQGMAANCSKDVGLVVDYMDSVFESGTVEEQYALKKKFGLESLENPADVMSVLENGPWAWQGLSFYSGYAEFFQFCDAIENVEAGASVVPDANGVGLEKALAGYANWVNTTVIPGYCEYYGYTGERNTECMVAYNASNLIYEDRTVGNVINLQWNWMLCNEPLAFWQDGAPENQSTIVSRLVSAQYWQGQCGLFFPSVDGYTYGSNASATVQMANNYTKGWDLEGTTRLTWTNGQYDPWRSGSVSSEFRPDGPLNSTAQHPVNIIPDGVHCYDLIAESGIVNAGAQEVIDIETAQIVKWVSEYPAK